MSEVVETITALVLGLFFFIVGPLWTLWQLRDIGRYDDGEL